jgi:hypothetical protein
MGQLLAELWGWLRSWFVRETPVRPLRTVHLEELPDVLDVKDPSVP